MKTKNWMQRQKNSNQAGESNNK